MKTNFWKTAAVLLFGLAASATSCVDPNTQTPDPEPVFPEQVNKTVEPGKSCDIVIAPNLSWEVEISGDTEYFSLEFNGEPVPVASGKAGEHTLTVKSLSDESDFDQRQCTLTMTMAEKSEVIAVVNKNGKERLFSVYPVKIVDGEFESGEESGYSFSETESSDLSMTYKEGDFLTFFKVVANFDWRLKEVPEWAEVNLFEGRYVDAAKANVPGVVCLRGVNPKYPLDGDEGKLVFIIDDGSDTPVEVEKEITLSIGPANDIFSVSVGSEVKFNAAGHFFNQMSNEYQEGYPCRVNIVGVSGVTAYAFEFGEEGPILAGTMSSACPAPSLWVDFNLSVADETMVLQDMDLNITVKENSGEARTATVVVLPGTIKINNANDLVADSGMGIKDEYSQYCIALTQEGTSGGEVIVDGAISADNAVLANSGAKFEKVSAEDPYNSWVNAVKETFADVSLDNYYKLTVTKPFTPFTFSYAKENPFVDFALFEYGDNGMQTSGSPWVEFSNWDETNLNVSLLVSAQEEYAFKFIVIKSGDFENAKDFAVILVYYDPEQVIGAGDAFTIDGDSKGAVLEKMLEASGNFWMLSSEYNCKKIYELTWNCAPVTLALDFDYESVDDPASWDDEGYTSCVSVLPAGEGKIMVTADTEKKQDVTLLFMSDGGVAAILVCHCEPIAG